jgi:lysophospholipase L1-like esterase
MGINGPLRRTWWGLACLSVLIVGLASVATPSSAVAPAAGRHYLALGDSVSFGYVESDTLPPPNYPDQSSFVGYPEDVGKALGFRVANAACPGETSASLVDKTSQSNGCENGYRLAFPLHVSYRGSQLRFAVHYLRSHPRTQLVSLMIGANDIFLCQDSTTDGCASELPAVLTEISANVTDTLTAIRQKANYNGQVVILNYYALDYNDPIQTAGSQALNKAVDHAAKPFHVQIADGYGAFENAALHSGGDPCVAGLLTQLSEGGCGVHPSVAGQAVLALAVERVTKAKSTPTD